MTSGSTPAAAKTTCGRLNGDQLDMNKDIQETPKEQLDSETTEHIARAAVRRQPPASQHIAEEDPTAERAKGTQGERQARRSAKAAM